ncbi:MAG: (2Fe-2S) ferredoxin domain-containing protein [Candidatus Omnitrophica bacterium]|nr:(2Fe-2S) ferredoxin domain-containing protein [Candidatus Omnitrophota bacterium]
MERARVPFQKIVFVCINQREPHEACCSRRDSEAIAAALKARVKALGLSRMVRVSKSGCQDLCARGPNVMVFPDYAWYHGVTPGDVERIIQDIVRALAPTPVSSTPAVPTAA